MNVNYVIYGEERATIEKKIAQIAARLHVDKAQISVYDASATLLKVILEDSYTSSTDLVSVQHDIICFCTNFSRFAVDKFQIFFHRHGKWMMHCYITVLLVTPL